MEKVGRGKALADGRICHRNSALGRRRERLTGVFSSHWKIFGGIPDTFKRLCNEPFEYVWSSLDLQTMYKHIFEA
jgi:hypothetical protein